MTLSCRGRARIGANLEPRLYFYYQFARAGFTDYAIYDLPWVNALQGYYLIMALPEGSVRLYGEPLPSGMRTHAGRPWKGPRTNSLPRKK